ncbi:MAG TPA: hypothetical protein VFC85_06590, partial [Verrucomicrobiae bacterium]|nr:hypothetical protein [Verrucomicrobiae bacterium]
SPAWVDFLIVLGVIGLVTIVAFIWAIMYHQNGKPRRKRRRRHRRQINPTLAETGGLPPIREEEKSSGQTPPKTQP